MPPRKKKSEPNLLKKRRAKLDKMIVWVHNASVELDELWNAAMESQLGSFKITSDGKISGPCWDAVMGKKIEIHRMLNKIRGRDPKRSFEVLSKVYQQPLVLVQRLDLVTKIDQRLTDYKEKFLQPELMKHLYSIYKA